MKYETQNKLIKAFLALGLALAVTASIELFNRNRVLSSALETQSVKEQAEQQIGQYAINMMFECYPAVKMSSGAKQMMARRIAKVATDVYETVDQREHFVMIVAIESCFQKYVQSPTGPKGLTQVARSSFFEALKVNCGVKDVNEEDVWDTDLNLYAGACYYRAQIEAAHGNLPLASLRYNQGPESKAAKSYAKGGRFDNTEGLQYLASISFLKEKGSDQPVPGHPSYEPNTKVKKESAKSK